MPEQLNTRVEDCYQQAETFFKRPFKRPVVSLKLRGQKAGVAHLHENLLRFNRSCTGKTPKTSSSKPWPTKLRT